MIDPVAVDDSFDIASNSVAFPLNVLANDLEGITGALQVISVTTPDKGGTAIIGQGGLSIRYTPASGFGGTEFFTYTVRDAAGKTSSANITVHTLEGARADDKVEISLSFTDLLGNAIPAVRQGDKFQLHVALTDLRDSADIPSPGNPGVFAAYLDLLYNSNLVSTLPGITGSGFDFDVHVCQPLQPRSTRFGGHPRLDFAARCQHLQPQRCDPATAGANGQYYVGSPFSGYR